jgi:hypothetical protein
LLLGEAASEGDAEVAGRVVAAGEGCCVGDGVASGPIDCSTECEPVTAGNESMRAMSMKDAAAPIVTLARMLAVPRGPNAVLERLLEKSAPASALPGCSMITMTSTMHARMNSPYKI